MLILKCFQTMVIIAWSPTGSIISIFDPNVFDAILSIFITAAFLNLLGGTYIKSRSLSLFIISYDGSPMKKGIIISSLHHVRSPPEFEHGQSCFRIANVCCNCLGDLINVVKRLLSLCVEYYKLFSMEVVPIFDGANDLYFLCPLILLHLLLQLFY